MSENHQNKLPNISIIIPVYNDPYGLEDTLKSLVNQDYPSEKFEIIVADNGSSDNTLDIAEKFSQEYSVVIRTTVEDNVQSSYATRNKGIVTSKGTIIAFIDADMSVEKNWLTKICISMEKLQADYLACGVEIYSEIKSIFALYNKMTGFPIENYINNAHFAPTCCLVVRKIIFDELGMFDSRLISSGDLEFGNRVYESGRNLCHDPIIVMKHPARSSFKQLLKKSFRIGRGSCQLSFYYPERYNQLNRSIFNPMYYLPSIPWKFSISMKGNKIWDEAFFNEKIYFYLISWSNNLANHIGYIYEKGKLKKDNR